jgi:hypothetical protein
MTTTDGKEEIAWGVRVPFGALFIVKIRRKERQG